MAISDKSKIQNVVQLLNDVDYPNENETNLSPEKKIQNINNGHFLHYTGKSRRIRNMFFTTRKHSAYQVYKTLSLL